MVVLQLSRICSKLTMKTPEWRHSGVFMVNFDQMSDVTHCFCVPIVNFEQVDVG